MHRAEKAALASKGYALAGIGSFNRAAFDYLLPLRLSH
jgi:hypothetical protein